MSAPRKVALVGLVAVAAVTLSSCARLHTASMRVEVEVYKGPLSKTPQVQWGELDGLLQNIAEYFRRLSSPDAQEHRLPRMHASASRALRDLPECGPLHEMYEASADLCNKDQGDLNRDCAVEHQGIAEDR